MGGDGGQVIDRATMVKTKGWGLTKGSGNRYAASLGEMANYMQMVSEDRGLGPLERHRMRMSTCWLSQQALDEPVVACRLGNLYNKEPLIGALLNRTVPPELAHIRALKDVKQCLFTWAQGEQPGSERRMVCPVSREDLDQGSSRAVIIWPTGAVIAAKTLKELKLKECPLTGKPFDPEQDVIALAPQPDELERLRERLPAVVKKRKAAVVAAEGEEAAAPASGAASSSAKAPGDAKARKLEDPGKTAVYKSLFAKDTADGMNGMTGTRDAFGTPVVNRGTRCL